MRKIITSILLSFWWIMPEVYAQASPTYEQTVNYITENTKGRVMYPGDLDAYSRTKGYHLRDIKIERNGRVQLFTDQKYDANDFTITFNIFDLVEKVDYPDGIRAHKFLVHFNGLNVSSGYGITFATDADAQKVARAFRHLKTLCVKSDDLFSSIPAEEKKTKLSREETISYINNLLYYLPKSQIDTYEYNYPKPPSSYLNDKAKTHRYWFSKNAMSYNHETNQYAITNYWTYQYWGLRNGAAVQYDEQSMGDRVATFPARDIKDFNEDWDGIYLSGDTKRAYDGPHITANGTPYYNFNRYYKLFQINFNNGGMAIIRYSSNEPKFTSRLKNALLRLKELDKDNVDPFD